MQKSECAMANADRPAGGSWRVRSVLSFCILTSAFGTLAATAAHDSPLNPDDPAYLRRQYAWFQTLDPARQQQLRKLHADFLALDEKDQARLTRVMQSYNAWLARLPDADRQRVLAAPTAADRLDVVRQLREREWVEALPRPYREEYDRLDEDARRQKVQEWRAEEAERREEWAVAARHWTEFQPGKVPAMFTGDARIQFDTFVDHLRENLSEAERREVDEANAAAIEFGNYLWYAVTVARLANLHPILPGKVGPKSFDALPKSVKDYLFEHDAQHFRPAKGVVPARDPEVRQVRQAEGRWPDFARELTRYCQKKGLKLPQPLGDCRRDDMPIDVREFLAKKLEPELRKSERGRAELEALNRAQGSWPDYPQQMIDIARNNKLQVPGWTLPDKLRAARNRPGVIARP
jgi:hypothetical protein